MGYSFPGAVFGRVSGITCNMSQMKNKMCRFLHWDGNLNACTNSTEPLSISVTGCNFMREVGKQVLFSQTVSVYALNMLMRVFKI